jgi:small nuclear ribonucleoprotein
MNGGCSFFHKTETFIHLSNLSLCYPFSFHKTFIYGGFWIWIYQLLELGATMEPSKKPLNVLIKQLHGNIEVVLKNGCEYKGKMIKCDGHMNILLEGATESKQEQLLTNYGNVLLRGNNVLYIVLDPTKH